MDEFNDYLKQIDNPEHQMRMEELLNWVNSTFPQLDRVVKWNQPMFTDHDTYIIGFSTSKKHIAVAPEQAGINKFADQIEEAGYSHTKELFRVTWDQPVKYELLENIIAFNIEDKKDYPKFWRSVKK